MDARSMRPSACFEQGSSHDYNTSVPSPISSSVIVTAEPLIANFMSTSMSFHNSSTIIGNGNITIRTTIILSKPLGPKRS
ncbi:hypothetical protein CVS40_3011 [Lucilia cuprina]|nr:hypothetical protein CVS40_3011 [Lucilia cuprina]